VSGAATPVSQYDDVLELHGRKLRPKAAALDGPSRIDLVNGRASLAFTLPRQAVSLVVVEW
jgi:hypothetical protein